MTAFPNCTSVCRIALDLRPRPGLINWRLRYICIVTIVPQRYCRPRSLRSQDIRSIESFVRPLYNVHDFDLLVTIVTCLRQLFLLLKKYSVVLSVQYHTSYNDKRWINDKITLKTIFWYSSILALKMILENWKYHIIAFLLLMK